MDGGSLTFSFFLIFSGAAVLATAALYTRQPMLIAYIALGALIGPYGASYINNVGLLEDVGHIGIIFLLFLLGLDMQPQSLRSVAKQASVVAIASSLLFFAIGAAIAFGFGFTSNECIIIGVAMMFSSTIISIKLLPTTVLHHKHTGELIVGLLLIQDLIAIFVLIVLLSGSGGQFDYAMLLRAMLALPLLAVGALLFVRYVLLALIARFDRFHEYIFLLALGWCLGMAELAALAGLSAEIGAFTAGIVLATSPISQFIALNLRPLRDFFLVLFFFALGARFDTSMLADILLPTLLLTAAMIAVKPLAFRGLLRASRERRALSWSVGFRLGQNSEFSLLIAYVATSTLLIGKEASHLIQATAILTFLISTYIVIFNFPTPIAVSDKLRRD
ncbi:MAG: cation:proton antiporter [Gammaproteobacteria bacterium]|nr:cation:proton antiporter [Gammaproteobacteria bacterium]MBT8150039.1 cation:proton antiporter [Gammaproteobacteria bacterium]NNM10541.1 cation:proton antiporter [Pseudomonadales bacterium]RZV50170.1 MAG: cation:proton antiporter [Pseudomonadales bacterium]